MAEKPTIYSYNHQSSDGVINPGYSIDDGPSFIPPPSENFKTGRGDEVPSEEGSGTKYYPFQSMESPDFYSPPIFQPRVTAQPSAMMSQNPNYLQQYPVYLQQYPAAPTKPVSADGAFYLSYFVMLFCGIVFGVIAYILAVVGQDEASRGDVESARCYIGSSIGVSIAGIIVGIIAVAISCYFLNPHNKF